MNEELSGTGVARRRILQVAGASGAGMVLAACGSSDDDSEEGAESTESTTPATGNSSAAAGSSSAAATNADVVASVSQVPVGSGLITGDYVVTQPTSGAFKAFSKICTHQGCPVSAIESELIVCNCHNSAFSIKDGSVVRGPAAKPLNEVAVTVDGDNVVKS